MLLSINWIKNFVKLPEMPADELANVVTMSVAEVEDVISTAAYFNQVKVAEIKSFRPHPEADKLNLVTFDYGAKETKEVVCGAPNVKNGIRIFYAPIGTTLPNGMTLEPKKIRGVLSDGMLCSAPELSLGESPEGLLVLSNSTPIGQTLKDYLKKADDVILEIDNKSLTHRPDLWGHYGFARELAAIFKMPLSNPFNSDWQKKIEAQFNSSSAPIKLSYDKDSALKAYWGLSIDGVKVGPSSAELKEKLESVGLRSINNIVDISNYVMIELGMPNHIFDRNEIQGGQINIRRATAEEKLKTLDEVDRSLVITDTVIADSSRPLVIAGIMGGLESGVSDKTKNIFIEVANWKAAEVRRTSTRLGLRTDSSQRYEKSLDSHLCYRTLLRLAELVLKEFPQAKFVGKPTYIGEELKAQPLVLETSVAKICNTLGKELAAKQIQDIFESLDFKVTNASNKLTVTIPTYRTTKDISCEADLIEEIGRVIGYDNIIEQTPSGVIKPVRLTTSKQLHRKIQDFFSLAGQALEIMTYPLVGEKLLKKASWLQKNDELKLINALSIENDRMRPSLIPSLLEAIAVNQKNFANFRLFELGRVYLPDDKNFNQESNQVALVHFSKDENNFTSLINSVEKLLNFLSLSFELAPANPKFNNSIIPNSWSGVHPREYLNVKIMGKFLGALTSIHPIVLREFKIKGNVSVAIIDLSEIEKLSLKDKTKYLPISRFPSVVFDCSVVMNADAFAADALKPLRQIKMKEFKQAKIIDVYPMSDSQKSVTIRSTFEDSTQTLSPEIVKQAEVLVVQTLAQGGFPLKQNV
ncbi:MAG: phenylalanine--tRNA ligase subunit beta [Bacteriovoracaceae bacterium]|nr:phenylalanine--tRNA ligase subunit beta [Bacteriovoracaceae bacterium]